MTDKQVVVHQPKSPDASSARQARVYLRELRMAFQAEVLGEASYAVLSRLKLDKGRRAKFDALRKLETQLKLQLSAAIKREGHQPRESWLAKLIGGGVAAAAAPLPWRLELRVLAAIIKTTVPAFERFERKFAERDPDLARSLAEHERAQLEFFLRELRGDEHESLEPVTALLD